MPGGFSRLDLDAVYVIRGCCQRVVDGNDGRVPVESHPGVICTEVEGGLDCGDGGCWGLICCRGGGCEEEEGRGEVFGGDGGHCDGIK